MVTVYIEVAFYVESELLKIHIKYADSKKISTLTERSDGLRQFVALRAFTSRDLTIANLLVDEAEQHLHYDGQALIQMFARQKIASKIV